MLERNGMHVYASRATCWRPTHRPGRGQCCPVRRCEQSCFVLSMSCLRLVLLCLYAVNIQTIIHSIISYSVQICRNMRIQFMMEQ